jgi:hypothetical protein
VELEDDSGRVWQMTYRCVPHRYSYELRAGWKVGRFFTLSFLAPSILLPLFRAIIHEPLACHGAMLSWHAAAYPKLCY